MHIFFTVKKHKFLLALLKMWVTEIKYRTRAIIARSRSETALEYKPRILGLKNEEFPFLVHKVVCNINLTSI